MFRLFGRRKGTETESETADTAKAKAKVKAAKSKADAAKARSKAKAKPKSKTKPKEKPLSLSETGKRGEQSAASFLAGKGYTVIDRNYRCGHLELDIIAKNDTYVVFVEVKTRRAYPGTAGPYGRPACAVDRHKGARITCAATEYLHKNRDALDGLIPRYDIIEVYLSPETADYKVIKIIHMENTVSYG